MRFGEWALSFLIGAIAMGVFLNPPMHNPYSTPIFKTGSQFSSIAIALKTYRLDFGQYPSDENGLAALLNTSIRSDTYIEKAPVDQCGKPYKYVIVSGYPLVWTDHSLSAYGVSFAYWLGGK